MSFSSEQLEQRPFGDTCAVVALASRSECGEREDDLPACKPYGLRKRTELRAWAMLARMNIQEGLDLVEALDADRTDAGADTVLLRAAALVAGDDAEAAMALARDRLGRQVPATEPPAAALLARMACWKARDLDTFGRLSRPDLGASRRRRDVLVTVLHLSMEAAVEADLLRLDSARRLANDALSLSDLSLGPEFPASRLAISLKARLLYEQDEIGEADRLIRDRLMLAGTHAGIEGALMAYMVGSRIAAARGQTQFAILLLREAEELGRQRCWTRLVAASLSQRVRLLLEIDKPRDAQVCLRKLEQLLEARLDAGAKLHVVREFAIARARYKLEEGADSATASRLREIVADCRARGEHHLAVELQALLACVLLALDREMEATIEAAEAFERGAAAGLYRTFLDGGPAMRRLLCWFDARVAEGMHRLGTLRPYVRRLLSAIPQRIDPPASARARHRSGESLSPRERDIVRLISHGLSNKRIAKQLDIAPETVKSHAKHIMLKLAAQTRVEAVARALSLGII